MKKGIFKLEKKSWLYKNLVMTIIVFISLFFVNSIYANPYVDSRIIPVTNCEESDLYCVIVQIKGEQEADYIGNSSIRIDYDADVLFFSGNSNNVSSGSFTSINFDDNQMSIHPDCENNFGYTPYAATTFDGLVPGDILATIVLLSPTVGDNVFACPQIGGEWTDVFEICFEVLDEFGDPDLLINGIQNGPANNTTGTNFNPDNNSPIDKYWNGSMEGLNFSFNELCNGISGCVDPIACNYNVIATENDGSCEYPVLGCTCGDLDCNPITFIKHDLLLANDNGSTNVFKGENELLNKDKHKSNEFILSPNPSSGQFFIKIQMEKAFEQNIIIYDINGKVIIEQIIPAKTSKTNFEFNLSEMPKGFYIISLQSEKTFSTKKLLFK